MPVNLNLNDKNSTVETSILFLIHHNGIKRIKIASKEMIVPKDWNPETQKAKRSHRNWADLNRTLGNKIREVEDALSKLDAQQKPITKENIERLLSWRGEKVQAKQALFTELKDKFIEHRGASSTVKPITIDGYESTFKVLIEYMRVKEVQIDIHSFAKDDFNLFRTYCQVDRGNTNNGFDKTAKNLGVFLRWCKERGYTDHDAAKAIDRTKSEKEINPLLPSELAVLERSVNVFSGQREDVRRMFLMQCYTGLRIKDLKELTLANIKGDVIRVTLSKVPKPVIIPIIPKAREILDHYLKGTNGNVFPLINDQVYNRYLKEIFTDIGLNREVLEISYFGKRQESTTRLMCDAVSSHDGRRTFITLLLNAGMNAWQLMAITGHKNFDSFQKYVKYTDGETATRVIESWNIIHNSPEYRKKVVPAT